MIDFSQPFGDDDRSDGRPADPRDPAIVRQRREGWLEAIRRRVKPPPRNLGMGLFFGPWATPYPPWLRPADPLQLFFKERRRMLRTGIVVWGAFVQANSRMSVRGVGDSPGEVIYCPDPLAIFDPDWLLGVAGELSTTKDEVGLPPDLEPIGEYLAEDSTRAFGRIVPRSVVGDRELALSTVLIFRRHVPGKRLCHPLVPLLVAAEPPRIGMIVPQRFWPREMRTAWAAGEV